MTLPDGGSHAVDSSALAFEIASKASYRQSMPKAGPQILEPIIRKYSKFETTWTTCVDCSVCSEFDLKNRRVEVKLAEARVPHLDVAVFAYPDP